MSDLGVRLSRLWSAPPDHTSDTCRVARMLASVRPDFATHPAAECNGTLPPLEQILDMVHERRRSQ